MAGGLLEQVIVGVGLTVKWGEGDIKGGNTALNWSHLRGAVCLGVLYCN